MRRENDFTRDPRNRRIETDAFLFHARTDRFQNSKSAMTFVQVQDARAYAHGTKSAISSNAEQQLLPDSHAGIAAV